jgi:hypothetical protein
MIKRLALALIGLLAFSIGTVAQVAPAQAANAHTAHFWNYNSSTPILMCKNWTKQYGDGRNEPGTCQHIADGGAKRYLYRGYQTNTTFGWGDTDGFYVKQGHRVAIRNTSYCSNCWSRYNLTGYGWGWRKKSGCWECVYEIKQYRP